MNEQSSREELQTKAIQLEYINRQIKVMESHLSEVESAINELSVLKVGLRNLSSAKEGDDVLVPLGASSYVPATLDRADRVLISVGAGVFVERELDKAVPVVDKQIGELQDQEEKVMENMSKLSKRSDALTQELNRALQVGANV